MIRSLCAATFALAGAGLVVATAASAASTPSATTASSKQAGYVAVPDAFHSAVVTVHVPRLTCAKKSPDRTVQLGLFASETQAGVVRPFSVTVQASCRHGAATYRAVHDGSGGGGMRVHHGDVVRLALIGVEGYSIEDRTTGAGEGGGGGEAGPGATHPKADRPVLIGVQWVGPRPSGLRADFTKPLVNHTELAKVTHHKHGTAPTSRVGALHDGRFTVTFAPHRTR